MISKCLVRKIYEALLFVSVDRRAAIGQFCGPYSTKRPAKFKKFDHHFTARLINLKDIMNILITSFSLSVL